MAGRARRWTSGLLAVLVVASGLALAQAPVAADEPAPAPTYPVGRDRTPPPNPAPAPVAGTADVNPVTVTGSRGIPSARWKTMWVAAQERLLPTESTVMGPDSAFTSLVNTYPSYCYAAIDHGGGADDPVLPVQCGDRGDWGSREEVPFICLYDRVYFTAGTRVVGACPGDPGRYDPVGCMTPGRLRLVSCDPTQDPADDTVPAPYSDTCHNHLHDPTFVPETACKKRVVAWSQGTGGHTPGGEPAVAEFSFTHHGQRLPGNTPVTVTTHGPDGVQTVSQRVAVHGRLHVSVSSDEDVWISVASAESDVYQRGQDTVFSRARTVLRTSRSNGRLQVQLVPGEVRTLTFQQFHSRVRDERIVTPRTHEFRYYARQAMNTRIRLCRGIKSHARERRCIRRAKAKFRRAVAPDVAVNEIEDWWSVPAGTYTTDAAGRLSIPLPGRGGTRTGGYKVYFDAGRQVAGGSPLSIDVP